MSGHVTVGWTRKAAKPHGEWSDGADAGPWHAQCDGTGLGYLSWCGSRLKGINRDRQSGPEAPTDGTVCKPCLTAIRQGKPRSYSR